MSEKQKTKGKGGKRIQEEKQGETLSNNTVDDDDDEDNAHENVKDCVGEDVDDDHMVIDEMTDTLPVIKLTQTGASK